MTDFYFRPKQDVKYFEYFVFENKSRHKFQTVAAWKKILQVAAENETVKKYATNICV